MRLIKFILSCLSILAGVVLETTPDQVTSNLSRWWTYVGVPPNWAISPIVDYRTKIVLVFIGVCGILWSLWPTIKNFQSRIKIIGLLALSTIFLAYALWSIPSYIDKSEVEKLKVLIPKPDRYLSETQKTRLLAALKEIAPSLPSVNFGAPQDAECQQYLDQFRPIFKAAGITITEPLSFYFKTTQDNYGVMVGSFDVNFPSENRASPAGVQLGKALTKGLGFPPYYTATPNHNDELWFIVGYNR